VRLGGTHSMHGVVKYTYNILVGNPEVKRLFGRPRRRWEDNIKIHILKK
jgi:hypothetical protein